MSRAVILFVSFLFLASSVHELRAGDILTAWGLNQYGELGVGDTTPRYSHARVPQYLNGGGLTGLTAVACGAFHSLALTTGGAVKVWGHNDRYQLGLGAGDTADRWYQTDNPDLTSGVRAIACGGNHSLAVKTDNTLWGWGVNAFGQLGVNPLLDLGREPSPHQFSNLSEGVSNVAAGANHTIALLRNTTLKACGNNVFGQLGLGTVSGTNFTMTLVPGVTNVIQVACGNSHSVALLGDGTVKSWGLNESGQLGLGDASNRSSATTITGLSGVAKIACGAYHTLFLLTNGTVMACGQNIAGQLGLSDTSNRFVPTLIAGLSNVADVAAGDDFSMALLTGHTMKSWGANAFGELGLGFEFLGITNPQPQEITGLGGVRTMACGNFFTLAWGWEVPYFSVTPTQYDFGLCEVGYTNKKLITYTVQNYGHGDATCEVAVAYPFSVYSFPDPVLWDDEHGYIGMQFTPTNAGKFTNRVDISGASNGTIYAWALGEAWIPHFVMKWTSTVSATYRIMASSNLSAGFPYVLATNLAATPPTNRYAWTNENPEAFRAYRIEADVSVIPRVVEFRRYDPSLDR